MWLNGPAGCVSSASIGLNGSYPHIDTSRACPYIQRKYRRIYRQIRVFVCMYSYKRWSSSEWWFQWRKERIHFHAIFPNDSRTRAADIPFSSERERKSEGGRRRLPIRKWELNRFPLSRGPKRAFRWILPIRNRRRLSNSLDFLRKLRAIWNFFLLLGTVFLKLYRFLRDTWSNGRSK